VPELIRTREAATEYVQAWFTAFPDMRVRRTNRVIGEDSVAGEIEFTGTNTGPLSMGGRQLPPTGKSVVGIGAYFVKVKDGKVTGVQRSPGRSRVVGPARTDAQDLRLSQPQVTITPARRLLLGRARV
jgi:SnoaL-like polyketide cyclase